MADTDLGRLATIVLVSPVLTGLLSLLLLWVYRRAVIRGMSKLTGPGDAHATYGAISPLGGAGTRPLRIVTMDAASAPVGAVGRDSTSDAARTSLRRLGLAYLLAGMAYTLCLTVIYLFFFEFTLGRLLWFLVDFSWPTVFAAFMLLAMDRRGQAGIVGTYLAVAVVVGSWVLLRSPDVGPADVVLRWLTVNGPGTLLLLLFLVRRVRAVGPLLLPIMVAGVTGAVTMPHIIATSDPLLSVVGIVGESLDVDGGTLYWAATVLAFIVVSTVGWLLLRWAARLYQRKAVSDQMLVLDAMFLLFAVSQTVGLWFQGLGWMLAGPIAFVVYRLVFWASLRMMIHREARQHDPRTLLLLRVFSLGPRSQRLFDVLTKRWLHLGSMSLIAGPDLATACVEPHEFWDFLSGRLSRQFVAGTADLWQRLAALDAQPDPDGRYRVNEFFCRNDTWQMTMQQLVARSDAVLMDLRNFSPSNQGCLYELEQLLNGVYLPQVLLIVDASTDLRFLVDRLLDLWRKVPANSPNRSLWDPEVRLYQVDSGTGAEARTLLSLLYQQVRPIAVPQAAGGQR